MFLGERGMFGRFASMCLSLHGLLKENRDYLRVSGKTAGGGGGRRILAKDICVDV